MPPCEVENCPSVARRGSTTCQLHATAATAKQIGQTGQKCVGCGRVFRDGDFVRREPVRRPTPKQAGLVYGYAHVRCEPVKPRKLPPTDDALPFEAEP